ncbi:uncharacterized protein FA14DRAFT_119578 [Meira miltonrushii]|uniref:GH16 domain-containing protein n=1 Tax=Meira miltonrushii TaxID=1280837 RepID=A0A316VQC3_9BASI|nr:uncharacterized protein FA14DRAFT_119578 [Meira miltonrushii]PWN38623.1 hypothetical protein FA14DRAFT_119578 [Meira miltonrushii]
MPPITAITRASQISATTKASLSSISVSSSTSSTPSTSLPSSSSTVTYTSGLPLPTYSLTQANRGANFFETDYWNFWSDASDPTHGTVTYVNQSTAYSLDLIGVNSNNQAFIRASQQDLDLGVYRPSVRFGSFPAYDSALVIIDVAKMPVGCATWPAIWSVMGSEWPEYGEIDFMEGIGYTSMGENANLMSVHMNDTSYLTSSNDSYLGTMSNSNCMTNYGLGNTGCDFYDSNVNGPSWGVPFNNAGGGIWAALWGNKMGVRIWFWGRESGLIPSELSDPTSSPAKLDPSKWGKPMADFQSSVINQKLRQQNLVLGITINGDWAGNVPMDNTQQCGTNRTIALATGSNYADAEFVLNGIDVYT